MPGPAFPSWAYNATLRQSQIVASQAAFNALGSGWSFSPFPDPVPSGVPFDVTGSPTVPIAVPITDTRLQQILVEARMLNIMFAHTNNITDDLQTILRPDVLANDSGIAT